MTWKKTRYPGVRYREHSSRRHGSGLDRYYTIRYKGREDPLGWASDGMSPAKAAKIRGQLMENIRAGQGPQSLAEYRELAERARQVDENAATANMIAALTIKNVADRYIQWAKVNKRSWRTDDLYLANQILPALGRMPMGAVNRLHVENLRDGLLAGKSGRALAPATVKNVLVLLRRLYYWAAEQPYSLEDRQPLFSGVNPVKGVSIPKPDNDRLRYLTHAEAAKFLERARTFLSRQRDPMAFHDACALSLNTGMRKSEVLNLDGRSIDLASSTLTIYGENSKDKRRGVVTLNDAAVEILQRRMDLHGQGVLFPGQYGGSRMRKLSHNTRALADEMGLNDGVTDPRQRVCFHTFRHTFASWLALQGADIYVIMELLRHKSIGQTMRYAHLSPNKKRTAVNRLNQPQK